uniref:Putative permease of the major facilitator superfamily protein n=1 Tax=Amblyomma aureolatum TaxID=187763 RepID=A0A1E1X8L5_9ACAR
MMKPAEKDGAAFPAASPPKISKHRKGERFFDFIPCRHIFVLMGFLGLLNVYSLRVNLSVALVAMVKSVDSGDKYHNHSECFYGYTNVTDTYSNNTEQKQETGEFEWDSYTQGIILGSFFYGYVITQLPGGRIAEVLGARWMFGLGVFLTAVLTLAIPVASRAHYGALIAIRVLQGLGEGVTYPAMHSMLAQWSPKFERSTATALVHAGAHVGAMAALTFSGFLAASSFLGGWPAVFYVFGFLGCIWFVFWMFLVYDSPEDHPRITQEEYDYILINQGDEKVQKNLKIPWKPIAMSKGLWALSLAHFGSNWIYYTFLTIIPSYLATILLYDIKKNGLISSLPYLLTTITSCLASVYADVLRKKGIMSTTAIRKFFNTSAAVVPALLLIGMPMAGCDRVWSVVLLSLAGAALGVREVGFMVTHIDMSPDFAGTLLGVTNTIGNLPGFLMPYVAGVLTSEENSIRTWSYFYYIAAAVGIICAAAFLFFGTAELQPWGKGSHQEQPASPDVKEKPSKEDEKTESSRL